MKFDINNYDGRYERCCMHCNTLQEAIIFTTYLNSIGKTWCSGAKYTEDNLSFDNYGSSTCYDFNAGEYCNVQWFLEHHFTILEFEDFEWDGYTGNALKEFDEDVNILNSFLSGFLVSD